MTFNMKATRFSALLIAVAVLSSCLSTESSNRQESSVESFEDDLADPTTMRSLIGPGEATPLAELVGLDFDLVGTFFPEEKINDVADRFGIEIDTDYGTLAPFTHGHHLVFVRDGEIVARVHDILGLTLMTSEIFGSDAVLTRGACANSGLEISEAALSSNCE